METVAARAQEMAGELSKALPFPLIYKVTAKSNGEIAEVCRAFSNTFQDLYGMEQLPGLASQHLMAQSYGYGGEGDCKVSA